MTGGEEGVQVGVDNGPRTRRPHHLAYHPLAVHHNPALYDSCLPVLVRPYAPYTTNRARRLPVFVRLAQHTLGTNGHGHCGVRLNP